MQELHVAADKNYEEGSRYYHYKEGERQENLLHAIAHYEEALKFYTAENSPDMWAKIQEDITNAYSELAQSRISVLPSPMSEPFVHKRKSNFSRLQWPIVVLFALVFIFPFTLSLKGYLTAGNGPSCVAGTLTMDGSTALQPLIISVATNYMQHCPDTKIVVAGGASKTGLIDVEQGKGGQGSPMAGMPVQIGDSDIFALPTQSDLVDHQVAIGIFAMILNGDIANIHNLSTSQLRRIYTTAPLKWNDICNGAFCGPDLKIVPISRTTNSGTRFTFEKYILGGVATVPGIGLNRTRSSSIAVQEVEQTPGSVGYAPLQLAKQSCKIKQTKPCYNITIVSIDGHNPQETSLVKDNTYNFWNIEHMYTRGRATPLAQSFIDYMYSDFARQQAYQLDFLTLTDIPQNIRDSHQRETLQ